MKTDTMLRSKALVFVAIIALGSSSAAAQCSIAGADFRPYGSGCTPLSPIGFPPQVRGSFDAATCSLSLDLVSIPVCCGNRVQSRLLLVGSNRTSVPLTFLGLGCTLLVQPAVFLPLPGPNGAASVRVPGFVPAGLTLVMQGALLQTHSSGRSFVEISGGVQMTTT